MKLGFIGLGIMGLPMAKNLLEKSDCTVLGYDPSEVQINKFKDCGGVAVKDVNELYTDSDIIFLCLPSNTLVEQSIKDILQYGKKGVTIVDLGSTSPKTIREYHDKVIENGMFLMDAPVSGGESGAINGSLAILCGGDISVFERILPKLKCMGSTVTFMGGPGSGDIAKLANNMILANYLAGIAEAFAYTAKAGLDSATFFEAIKNGFVSGTALTMRTPKMIKHDFSPSAKLSIHHKDLKNAVDFAHSMGVEVPMTEKVYDIMSELSDAGHSGDDHSIIAAWFEEKMGSRI